MTRDDIIRFGEQADEVADRKIAMRGEYHPDWHAVRDEAFAALVAAEKDTEIDILRRELALVEGQSHPGYVIGMHWLASAYHRICAGEPERDVMLDYGYIMERGE